MANVSNVPLNMRYSDLPLFDKELAPFVSIGPKSIGKATIIFNRSFRALQVYNDVVRVLRNPSEFELASRNPPTPVNLYKSFLGAISSISGKIIEEIIKEEISTADARKISEFAEVHLATLKRIAEPSVASSAV